VQDEVMVSQRKERRRGTNRDWNRSIRCRKGIAETTERGRDSLELGARVEGERKKTWICRGRRDREALTRAWTRSR
jgi:hypothetical protein